MIYKQVKNTIEKNHLIEKGDKVLLCVSGGPDSMTLLHIMRRLEKEYDIKLVIAHLDHMLRGNRSIADANFVKETSSRLNIPAIIERINVRRISNSSRMSIEEAAREVRYGFYKKAAEKSRANKIATAHTMDDQAETVLMRFIKGSGSLGLSGIPYKRKLENACIIRPLLDIKRSDIEKYLKRYSIASRLDASNLKKMYLRNKLRLVLIPLLEKDFNPRVKENVNLISKNLNDEFDYLNTLTKGIYKKHVLETKKAITISINSLRHQHVALQRLLVRQIINKLKGNLKRINFRHWQGIESMLSGKDATIVKLPDGLNVIKKGGKLVFTKVGVLREVAPKFRKVIKLNIPGRVIIPELGVEAQANVVNAAPKFKKGDKRKRVEYINGDLFLHPLKIRTRRKGDKMRPLGMKSYKKLHDIFVDEKVPRGMRDRIPLFIGGNSILWAAGLRLSEECKIDRNTKRVIKLELTHIKK